MPKNKCAIYTRVSTGDQNIENQLSCLEQWASQREFEVVAVYREKESAWRSGHQSVLTKAVNAARSRKYKVLLVWSLDRLSRQGALAILSLVHKLSEYGVKVLSYQETWTEAPGELGEMLYAITGWVAQMESQRISERTKAGLARAAREGRYPGRPKGSKDKRERKKRGYFARWAK